jgi:hypothetical protein
MTDLNHLSEPARDYFRAVCQQSEGGTAKTISMYDVGDRLGLDREQSSRLAQELMGWELVEIRTLSGGIALTEEGLHLAEQSAGGGEPDGTLRLGTDGEVDGEVRKALETLLDEIRMGMAPLKMTYEQTEMLIIDVKTITVQLLSPHPKSAIVREVLHAIRDLLDQCGAAAPVRRLNAILG